MLPYYICKLVDFKLLNFNNLEILMIMTKYVVTLSVISDNKACSNDNRTDIKSFIYDDRKEAIDKYVALQQNVCLNGNIDVEHTYIIDKDNGIAVIDIIDDKQFMHRYRISINTIS